jgi:hypothetical protein
MTCVKWIAGAAVGATALIGFGLSVRSAQAGYIVTLEQVGSNVVATGRGRLDLTALTLAADGATSGGIIIPSAGIITTGLSNASDGYAGFSGPTSFGNGSGIAVANSVDGDIVGISISRDLIIVPRSYVSDSTLSDISTYDNATFTSLGVNPGTYVWTWGSGADADSFALQIGPAAMPEPSSLLCSR